MILEKLKKIIKYIFIVEVIGITLVLLGLI